MTFSDENVTSHLFVTVPHSNPGPGFLYFFPCLLLNPQNITSKQHSRVRGKLRDCRSNRSGASGLSYHCAQLVCVSDVIELLAMWQYNKPKAKNLSLHDSVWRNNPKKKMFARTNNIKFVAKRSIKIFGDESQGPTL